MAKPIEELIKMASHSPKGKLASDATSSVERFILTFDIQEGKYPIKNDIIYKQYIGSCAEKPLARVQFFQQFSKFFPKRVRTKSERFYMLDPTPFPEEQLDYLKGNISDEQQSQEEEPFPDEDL